MNSEPAHTISKRGRLDEGRPTKRTPEVWPKSSKLSPSRLRRLDRNCLLISTGTAFRTSLPSMAFAPRLALLTVLELEPVLAHRHGELRHRSRTPGWSQVRSLPGARFKLLWKPHQYRRKERFIPQNLSRMDTLENAQERAKSGKYLTSDFRRHLRPLVVSIYLDRLSSPFAAKRS
jgi:hypothetical protein